MRAARFRTLLAGLVATVILAAGVTTTTTEATGAPGAVAFGSPRDISIPIGSSNPNYRFSSIAILRAINGDGSLGAPYAQVAGLPDGTLVAYRLSDAARLWGVKVGSEIQASPAIAYSQGRAYIAVGSMDGWVHVVDQNGGVVFRQQLAPGPGGLNGVFGTPAMADLDGDGGQIGRATRLNSSHLVTSYAVFCLKKNT